MYQRLPNWVLGFHGTDKETVNKILNDPKGHLKASENKFDWLGYGIYFWENDPVRALEYSQERMRRNGITDQEPAVIGAVIDLGLCLNMFDQPALQELSLAHFDLKYDFELFGIDLPTNKGGKDRLTRYLDCMVIQHLHSMRGVKDKATGKSLLPSYQTVRAGFHEGDEVYEGSGFLDKNHIQIAVRDQSCIKGYFLPRNQ